MIFTKFRFGALFVALCLSLSAAVATPKPAAIHGTLIEELDQTAIHKIYNDGDFEPVIEVLESFQKRNASFSFSDSVFIAKHLAVVYTANPATREKGRYYMIRLLELVPSAKLVDMFVSEEVDRIFDKVREEFLARQRGFGLDTLTIRHTDKPKEPADNHSIPPDSSRHASKGWNRPRNWVIGGIAVAAIGGAAYFYYAHSGDESSPREVISRKPE